MTEEQRKAFEAAMARAQEKEAARANVPTERLRTAAQGATFGFSEEAEAALTAPLMGQTYEERLNELRGRIKAYKETRPVESLSYEVGGAVLPALVTAGSAAPLSAARMAGLGAIEGGMYAFGTGEGGFMERASRVPGGALAGAVVSPLVGKAAPYIAKPFVAIVDIARRRLGGRGAKIVETELQRLVDESGMTVDEIVDGVASGRIIAENATLRDAIRAYRMTGGPAASTLKETLGARPAQTRDAAMREIQTYLADAGDDNIVRSVRRSDDAFAEETSKAYAPFKNQAAPDNVKAELVTAIQRVPGSADELNTALLAETGGGQFLRVTPPANGIGPANVEFARPPTLYEAELVRRTIKNYSSSLYQKTQGTAGEAVKGVELNLRGALDASSDALRATRANVATFKTAREQFDAGQKAFSQSADQVEVDFEAVAGMGEAALKAYRAGIVDALRNRVTTGRGKSLMTTLADPSTKEGKILRTIFPQDQLDGVLEVIETAAQSQQAATRILGGSDTAITAGQAARQGALLTAEDLSAAASGDMVGIAKAAGKIVKSMAPELTDAQRLQIVRVLVSEDPVFVRNALQDRGVLAIMQTRVEQLARLGSAGTRGGAVSQTAPVAGLLSQQAIGPQ